MSALNRTSSEPESPSASVVRKKIVIVDDDRDFRDVLSDQLTHAGYDVLVVPNGLRLMAALKIDKPDLLLLDVMMSWINGLELCRALKRNVDYRDIPVVFISAKSSAAEIREGLDCGAVDYVTKPFPLATLLCKILRFVGPIEGDARIHRAR
jgi:DNA-binding response OmpR family regulator